MLRTAFRVSCILLLATIILDVTNSKCFNKSLTYKYSKNLGSGQVPDSILSVFNELKKTLRTFTCLPKEGLPKYFKDVCAHWKPFAYKVAKWTTIIYKDPKRLIECIKKFTCSDSPKNEAVGQLKKQ